MSDLPSSDTIGPRLRLIRERLESLREKDRKLEVFGAHRHKYLLRPCASEEQLAAFEERCQARLPQEYRRFLLEVGDGGPGPFYGLESLSGCLGHLYEEPIFFRLDKPFVHRGYWNLMDEWESEGRDPEMLNLYEAEMFRDENVFGSIVLSHEGCGMMNLLVVSGPESGFVWKDDRCNTGGVYPLLLSHEPAAAGWKRFSMPLYEKSNGPRIGFLDWYEHWLNRSLSAFS